MKQCLAEPWPTRAQASAMLDCAREILFAVIVKFADSLTIKFTKLVPEHMTEPDYATGVKYWPIFEFAFSIYKVFFAALKTAF